MYFLLKRMRRTVQFLCGLLVVILPVVPLRAQQAEFSKPELSKLDIDLLDDISRRSFHYFWDQMDPVTGLVRDRAPTTGEPEEGPHSKVASIAATGFGLTALVIAADHRWIGREAARERVQNILDF